MTTFSVDTEAVRAIATRIEDARDASPTPAWPQRPDFGHAALQTEASAFTSDLSEVWADRVEELGEVASRLHISADTYDDADAGEAVGGG